MQKPLLRREISASIGAFLGLFSERFGGVRRRGVTARFTAIRRHPVARLVPAAVNCGKACASCADRPGRRTSAATRSSTEARDSGVRQRPHHTARRSRSRARPLPRPRPCARLRLWRWSGSASSRSRLLLLARDRRARGRCSATSSRRPCGRARTEPRAESRQAAYIRGPVRLQVVEAQVPRPVPRRNPAAGPSASPSNT